MHDSQRTEQRYHSLYDHGRFERLAQDEEGTYQLDDHDLLYLVEGLQGELILPQYPYLEEVEVLHLQDEERVQAQNQQVDEAQ